MAQPSTTLQTTYSFFHSNNKTLSEETQYLFESQYAGGHVLFTKDVLIDPITYCPDVASADAFVAANPTVMRKYTQVSLTMVPNTNGQSWYINDAGNGGWQKPIIVGSLVPEAGTNMPSNGFDPTLYDAGGTQIATTAGVWWVDPFQSIIKFAAGYTPGYTPKLTAYVYIGRKMTDFVSNNDPSSREYVFNTQALALPMSTTYNITHNLNSFNLDTMIISNDVAAGGYIEQVAPVVFTGVNTATINLTEAMHIIATFTKIGS